MTTTYGKTELAAFSADLFGASDGADAKDGNRDGAVDAQDYALWRDSPAGDGDTDGQDLLVWQREVGPVDDFDPGLVFGLPGAIYGTRGHDDIYGTESDDLIYGYTGNDQISGQGGDDVINGGAGNDHIWGDYREPDDQTPPWWGDPGDDVLHGGAGDDILEGGWGDDQLHGDAGDDFLIGGLGANHLWGGTGADIFLTFHEVDGFYDTDPDIVHDFEAVDSVYGSAWAVVGGHTLVFDEGFHTLFVLENYDANVDGITLLS